MSKWARQQYASGEDVFLGGFVRLGYAWDATRSRGADMSLPYVGSVSARDIRLKHQATPEAMKAALIQVARKRLTAALAELDELEKEPLPPE